MKTDKLCGTGAPTRQGITQLSRPPLTRAQTARFTSLAVPLPFRRQVCGANFWTSRAISFELLPPSRSPAARAAGDLRFSDSPSSAIFAEYTRSSSASFAFCWLREFLAGLATPCVPAPVRKADLIAIEGHLHIVTFDTHSNFSTFAVGMTGDCPVHTSTATRAMGRSRPSRPVSPRPTARPMRADIVGRQNFRDIIKGQLRSPAETVLHSPGCKVTDFATLINRSFVCFPLPNLLFLLHDPGRFQDAITHIDAANAQDPRGIELPYAQRLSAWVERLAPTLRELRWQRARSISAVG